MNIESNMGPVDVNSSPYTHWKTLDQKDIQITDGFWGKRQKTNQKVSLHHGFAMLHKNGNIHNLKLAAGLESGNFIGYNFADETVYKWLEAIAWEVGRSGDAELMKMADEVISVIQAAQQADGYLNSYYQSVEPDQKFANLDHSHELYCTGHLIQAAVAFKRAIDDNRLLQVVCRLVDLIDSIFGEGKREGTCGHPEIEMALVELYRLVNEERYLNLAKFFIDQRGKGKMRGYAGYGAEYHQDHIPLREAKELAGHAVRQMYLLSGAIDLYLETGETTLLETSFRLWDDLTGTKMYITGGVGSRYDGESFGNEYELPPDVCYCETCAAIGSLFWNWRMLLITGNSRYADLIEKTLFNGILACPDLGGNHFFYVNPLMVRDGRYVRLSSNPHEGEKETHGRPAWHEVACCPSNVMRLFASLSHYFASRDASGLQIHQYGQAVFSYVEDTGEKTIIRMDSNYPWDGKVCLNVEKGNNHIIDLSMRIPGWCPVFSLKVNDKVIPQPSQENGYISLSRIWKTGDRVELEFSQQPILIQPNPRIDAVRGCLAIQRGPLVYCLEAQDQTEGLNFLDIAIDPSTELITAWREDLGGYVNIEGKGYIKSTEGWQKRLYRPFKEADVPLEKGIRLTAIPYYLWGNRGLRSMRVWIPWGDA